ncbi:MAG TPA: OmpA family protein [Polyangia bacterium]
MGDVLPGSLSRLVGGQPEAHAVVTDRPAVVRTEQVRTPPRPGVGRYLLLVAAIVAALALLLTRRGARREAVHVPSTPQTQPIGNVARPQVLNAGDTTALTQALSGRAALPERFVLSDLTFRTDSAEIDPSSTRVLDGVASALAAHPGARIRVEGHTDNTGTHEANQPLSQARADSTRAYLVSKGIGAERIEAVGYGADRPLASNADQAGRAENRRTEIVVLQR